LAFHPYPQVIAAVFNRRAFGPPRGLTPASACPRIAHPASRPRRGTQVALLRLAFAPAPFRLTSPRASDSLAHSTKGTPSHPKRVLRLLVGARFQVLFHSPPGVLFTFPSRYWCAIGHRVVLRLGWWSTQVRTGFHVPGPTQGPRRAVRSGFAYGAVTRCGRPSHAVPLPSRTCARGRQPPDARPCNPVGGTPAGYARSTVWPSVPFRSPLLGESRD
jgi:hypothetical protein